MTTVEKNNDMNKIDFAKKVFIDFGSGALGFITLGAYHYVTICRENDKQLEIIRKENKLQLKKIEEKLQKYSWFKL